MYARSVMGRTLTFAFPYGLLKDNLLMYDKETGSLWSQMEAKAVSGPLEGTPLETFPVMQTSWGHWRSLHPDTEVMMIPDTDGHPYIYRSLMPGEKPAGPLTAHDITELGVGILLGEESRFYPFLELDKLRSPLVETLDGELLRIHFNGETPTAWITDGDGQLLQTTLAYRWAWLTFHPDSQMFEAPQ